MQNQGKSGTKASGMVSVGGASQMSRDKNEKAENYSGVCCLKLWERMKCGKHVKEGQWQKTVSFNTWQRESTDASLQLFL